MTIRIVLLVYALIKRMFGEPVILWAGAYENHYYQWGPLYARWVDHGYVSGQYIGICGTDIYAGIDCDYMLSIKPDIFAPLRVFYRKAHWWWMGFCYAYKVSIRWGDFRIPKLVRMPFRGNTWYEWQILMFVIQIPHGGLDPLGADPRFVLQVWKDDQWTVVGWRWKWVDRGPNYYGPAYERD